MSLLGLIFPGPSQALKGLRLGPTPELQCSQLFEPSPHSRCAAPVNLSADSKLVLAQNLSKLGNWKGCRRQRRHYGRNSPKQSCSRRKIIAGSRENNGTEDGVDTTFLEPSDAPSKQPMALDLPAEGKKMPTPSPFGVVHRVGDIVNGTYKIVGLLGQGGLGTMYEAVTDGGEAVALKAMSLRNMKGWKDMDLFKREARVLKSLKHPSIPEYVDYFEVDSATDRYFYLAQRVATGRSLADLVASGWRVSEEEVVRIALQVLEVLQYLEGLRPPVVHRDIKPENIILDEATGTVKVVDFGAVQEAAAATVIGSTVVGTYGYMAPEQFQNRATPQSDLYALGGTMLFLLSGRPPSSFPQKRLRISFRDNVRISGQLANVVERLLEPITEERFQSAAEATQALQPGPAVSAPAGSLRPANPLPGRPTRRPAGTKVVVERSASELRIQIPAVGLTAETVGTGSFALAWNAFIAFWTATAITGGAPLLFTAFSLPFWVTGAGLARSVVGMAAVDVELRFERRSLGSSPSSRFAIEWRLGRLWSHKVEGHAGDITSARILTQGEENGKQVTACEVLEGVRSHVFGGGLLPVEKEWIVAEIVDFLGLVSR